MTKKTQEIMHLNWQMPRLVQLVILLRISPSRNKESSCQFLKWEMNSEKSLEKAKLLL